MVKKENLIEYANEKGLNNFVIEKVTHYKANSEYIVSWTKEDVESSFTTTTLENALNILKLINTDNQAIYEKMRLSYYEEDVKHKIIEWICEEEDIDYYDNWQGILPPEGKATEESRMLREIFNDSLQIAKNSRETICDNDRFWECYWGNIEANIKVYYKLCVKKEKNYENLQDI